MTVREWQITGAEGESILGNAHLPDAPRGVVGMAGVVLVAHGWKGYKEYGMFPRIAMEFADAVFIAHRFNFSHSGMTNAIETFERPDLYERDTWNRQVADLRDVVEAVARGELAGQGLPYVIFGHSRGGVTALLTAGRFADDDTFPQPAGIITAAAPANANPFDAATARILLEQGWVETPSSRTGQKLRVGSAFLQEQLDRPEAHDVLRMTARINCPICIIHGSDDPTVPVEASHHIANAAKRAERIEVTGGDHVFNTLNPMPMDAQPSAQLRVLLDAAVDFSLRCCRLR